MGLTIWRLLEYFSVDELKLTLSIINESQTGNRNTLIERVIIEWPAHNKQWQYLLAYLDAPTLRRICNDYDLGHTGTRDVLSRRIIKELKSINPHPVKTNKKIPETISNLISDIPKPHEHFRPKKNLIYGIIIAIAVTGTFFAVDRIFPAELPSNESVDETIESKTLSEEMEPEMKPNPLIPFLDVWKTFNENRPYSLQWTKCAFGSHAFPEGEKSWSFSMTPILINKNGEPALIPFNISYRFNYEKIVDGKPLSLFGATSEGSQKHLVDVPDRKPISLHNFNDALNAALAEDATILKIMKTKSSFNPYSEEIDDNLLSEFESDKNDYLVAQFVFDENNESWSMLQPKEAICSNIYDT